MPSGISPVRMLPRSMSQCALANQRTSYSATARQRQFQGYYDVIATAMPYCKADFSMLLTSYGDEKRSRFYVCSPPAQHNPDFRFVLTKDFQGIPTPWE